MIDELLNILRESLIAIEKPHFFKTERGYQGQIAARDHKTFKRGKLGRSNR